jgi:hypothetical protein
MGEQIYLAERKVEQTIATQTMEESYKRDKHAIGAGLYEHHPGQPGFALELVLGN